MADDFQLEPEEERVVQENARRWGYKHIGELRNCLISQRTSIAVALDLLSRLSQASVFVDCIIKELNMIEERNLEMQKHLNIIDTTFYEPGVSDICTDDKTLKRLSVMMKTQVILTETEKEMRERNGNK